MKFNVYDFAIALTHFLFINVDVIKNHSGKQLSESFYEDAYTAVRKKFKKLDELLPDFYKRVYYRNDYMEIIKYHHFLLESSTNKDVCPNPPTLPGACNQIASLPLGS